jgi:hypothetical protein
VVNSGLANGSGGSKNEALSSNSNNTKFKKKVGSEDSEDSLNFFILSQEIESGILSFMVFQKS